MKSSSACRTRRWRGSRQLFGDFETEVADFSHLPVRSPFIMLMPQWDFLDFLRRAGEREPGFTCLMRTEATGLVEEAGRVVGLELQTQGGPAELRAPLVVAADGRKSVLRAAAGLAVEELGAPIDVMWFRLPRKATDTDQTGGRFDRGRLFVRIFRGDYWQCAFVIPKGTADTVRERGIEAFRAEVASLVPFEPDRADAAAKLRRCRPSVGGRRPSAYMAQAGPSVHR